jgi:hypothetical protein
MKEDKHFKNQIYRINLHSADNIGPNIYNQAYNIKMPAVVKRGKIYVEHFVMAFNDATFLNSLASVFIVSTSLGLPYQFTSGTIKQNVLEIIPIKPEGRGQSGTGGITNVYVHDHELTTEDIGKQLPDNLSLDNFYFSFRLLNQAGNLISAVNGDYLTLTHITFVIVDEEPNQMITIH